MRPPLQIWRSRSDLKRCDLSAWLTPRDVALAAINVDHLTVASKQILFPAGGQYLLDPGETNGWGAVGPYDDSNSQDLGNHDAAALSRIAGGISFPFDVNLVRFVAWHRNNNGAAEAWGWVISHLVKTAASNTQTTSYVLHETQANANVGPRDYNNNQNQMTDIDLSGIAAGQGISAGDVINLAVAAPTANTTNYQVQVQAGYLELERA